jgi:hypothetical protein
MAVVQIFNDISLRKLAREMLAKTLKQAKYKGAANAAARKALIDALVAKLRKKLAKAGLDSKGKITLTEGMMFSVGKRKTKKFGKLVDPIKDGSEKDKWSWWKPVMGPMYNTPELVDLKPPVKIADPDIINFNDDMLDQDIMADLIFEGIGGHEIINIARNDLVNGQPVIYRPIKNLEQLSLDYNSGTLLANENSNKTIFNDFGIPFEERLPLPGFNSSGDLLSTLGTGPNGEVVYLEDETGDIVINVANLRVNERVEIDLISNLNLFNDTIYIEENL